MTRTERLETHGLGAIAEYKRMLGDGAHSPVVDTAGTADQFVGALTVTYQYCRLERL